VKLQVTGGAAGEGVGYRLLWLSDCRWVPTVYEMVLA